LPVVRGKPFGHTTTISLTGAEKRVNVTENLFSADERLEQIPMQDAEVYYLRHLPLAETPHIVMAHLIDEIRWRAEKIVVWGKTYPQPRLIAWYGDIGKNYTYSGIHLEALPWTEALLDLKSRIEAATRTDFNSVLLNYYRDHRDSMGLHSDDEPELGERPILASLSLGEERTFILKHKREKALKPRSPETRVRQPSFDEGRDPALLEARDRQRNVSMRAPR